MKENYTDNSYATELRKSRRKGSGGTQEFFTPDSLVCKMCSLVDDSVWCDPERTFLEPSAGNGNFVVEIVRRRLSSGVSWRRTLETLFAVELMADNVVEMKDRVVSLLKDVDGFVESEARAIMDRNLVVSDFFKWDFENWKPID